MDTFATRLKSLRMQHKLRQKDLAHTLGVGQSAITNYEKGHRFPEEKTLHKIADLFGVSLDYLLGRTPVQESLFLDKIGDRDIVTENGKEIDFPLLTRQYRKLLLEGDQRMATQLALGWVKSGIKVEDVYFRVFEPALKGIGELWQLNEINVAQEHFFSVATEQIMSQLYPYISTAARNGHTLVAVTSYGELHAIGLRMIADYLQMQGWRSYYLGTNVPIDSLIDTLVTTQADLLLLSATTLIAINPLESLIKAVRSNQDCQDIQILVGGQAFSEDKQLWQKIGADGYGSNAQEALKFADSLIKT